MCGISSKPSSSTTSASAPAWRSSTLRGRVSRRQQAQHAERWPYSRQEIIGSLACCPAHVRHDRWPAGIVRCRRFFEQIPVFQIDRDDQRKPLAVRPRRGPRAGNETYGYRIGAVRRLVWGLLARQTEAGHQCPSIHDHCLVGRVKETDAERIAKPVLVVGAGPVGLVAASLLVAEGISVVLVETSTSCRAICVLRPFIRRRSTCWNGSASLTP